MVALLLPPPPPPPPPPPRQEFLHQISFELSAFVSLHQPNFQRSSSVPIAVKLVSKTKGMVFQVSRNRKKIISLLSSSSFYFFFKMNNVVLTYVENLSFFFIFHLFFHLSSFIFFSRSQAEHGVTVQGWWQTRTVE